MQKENFYHKEVYKVDLIVRDVYMIPLKVGETLVAKPTRIFPSLTLTLFLPFPAFLQMVFLVLSNN